MSGPNKCSVCKKEIGNDETVFRLFGTDKKHAKGWRKNGIYWVCSECMTEIYPDGIEPEGGVDATLFDEGE